MTAPTASACAQPRVHNMANVQGQKFRSSGLRFAEVVNATSIVFDSDGQTALRHVPDREPPEALLLPAVTKSDSSKHVKSAAHLLALASRQSPTPAVAVSIDWGEARLWSLDWLPPHYGHMWGFMYAFWQSFVAPRMRHAPPPPWVTIVLPAGPHVGWEVTDRSAGRRAFLEVEKLWSTNATRLRIERAPWVPICLRRCCWSDGARADSSDASLTFLLQHFPSHDLAYDRWPQFREDAWRSVGWPPPTQSSATGKLVWMVAASGSNRRIVRRELEVIQAVREMLAVERPTWRFVMLDRSVSTA
uniref:Uncharacterized protein n=1 Tax=Haptolina brevifila TaxID=156173 RepID=A0A6U7D9M3_9EUKA|mmetsp:Transcript_24158/g.48321  ORF Transcript_24158/g.48321 Transcript_24158/m.48321 type:complete len:303 (+) Transcript_24158:175-1083(+)